MLQPLVSSPSLIDQAYRCVLEAIADGSLAPGQRIRQAELAENFRVSRQPISHALHLLKRQGLVEDHGRKGLRVVPLLARRVQQLYQVREVVDGLAARLAAQRVRSRDADPALITSLQKLLATGSAFDLMTPVTVLVRADADFHHGLYALSGNPAIEEMTAPLWPHLMRSMAAVLGEPEYASRVWQQEHLSILQHVLEGDASSAEASARGHASAAASRTASYLGNANQAA